MKIGLRVDVDTFRGTRDGVPSLLRTFDAHGIRAAFFFSVGPDNMGRHLWRLLKPAFLWKMMRTKAASLYGLDILLMGTMWPGPRIGKRLEHVIRASAQAGHEIGVHAWDHHQWQADCDTMTAEQGVAHVKRAYDELERIIGTAPTCSASPGWRCTEELLKCKERLPFKYNSDCRGTSIFMPKVGDTLLKQPQIPLNLPTYDEMLGRDGVTNENYNDRLLEKIRPGVMNVLTIHAEAEGGLCAGMFEAFLKKSESLGYEFCAPGDLLPADPSTIPPGRIVQGSIPGREGTLAVQTSIR